MILIDPFSLLLLFKSFDLESFTFVMLKPHSGMHPKLSPWHSFFLWASVLVICIICGSSSSNMHYIFVSLLWGLEVDALSATKWDKQTQVYRWKEPYYKKSSHVKEKQQIIVIKLQFLSVLQFPASLGFQLAVYVTWVSISLSDAGLLLLIVFVKNFSAAEFM